MSENDLEEVHKKAKEMVLNSLEEGEEVLWAGKPIPYYFNNDVWIFFINGVIWTVLAIAAIVALTLGVMSKEGDWFSRFVNYSHLLLVLPLTLGACYAPLWNHNKMKRTVYALTNRKAIVLCPQLFIIGLAKKEYPLRKDMVYERRERHNGSGDLIFKEEEVLQRYGFGKKKRQRSGFVRLKELQPVEEILNKLLADLPAKK